MPTRIEQHVLSAAVGAAGEVTTEQRRAASGDGKQRGSVTGQEAGVTRDVRRPVLQRDVAQPESGHVAAPSLCRRGGRTELEQAGHEAVDDGLHSFGGAGRHVQVDLGRAQRRMPQQRLDGA